MNVAYGNTSNGEANSAYKTPNKPVTASQKLESS